MWPFPDARTFLLPMMPFFVAGCINTAVQTRSEVSHAAIPRPAVVMVYDFAVTPEDLRHYRKFFPSLDGKIQESDLSADDIELGHEAADALSEELVRQLKEIGMNAVHATVDEPGPVDSLAVAGYFVDIKQGSHLGRLVVGFGVGRSSMDTVVHVLAPEAKGFRDLLSFDAHSDSGRFPGAAVLGPAGLAAGAAVGGVIVSESAIGAVKTYRSALSRQALHLASKITSELSTYFEEQGWIEKK